MGTVIAFLLNNKTLVAAAALLLVIVVMGVNIKFLRNSNDNLKHEKEILSQQLDLSQASVKKLQSAIEDQNKAVEELRTDAEKRAKVNKAEIAKAQGIAANYKKQAEDLKNRKPPQNQNRCDAANELINSEIQNEK